MAETQYYDMVLAWLKTDWKTEQRQKIDRIRGELRPLTITDRRAQGTIGMEQSNYAIIFVRGFLL